MCLLKVVIQLTGCSSVLLSTKTLLFVGRLEKYFDKGQKINKSNEKNHVISLNATVMGKEKVCVYFKHSKYNHPVHRNPELLAHICSSAALQQVYFKTQSDSGL